MGVSKQRDMKQGGRMAQHRAALLEAEGFDWEHPYDTEGGDWEGMFTQLLAFREAEGHVAVKKKYDKNPALGFWVNEQRIAKREGRLAGEQIERLDALGFEW